uniref:Uncharacterized protein n=1 Tax=Rhizophagus irregularis (strain DAOM 181602 / DAOM 197198 / MUCL 43194) TaxID=747089 RepID=U9TN33_RHIID
MNDKSMMIFNGRVFHKAIKGLVNKRLFCGFKDKLFKEILGNLLNILLKNSLKNLSGYQVVKNKDIRDRWIGHYLEVGGNLDDIWFSLDISTYHRLIMFRSSQYVENYSILD